MFGDIFWWLSLWTLLEVGLGKNFNFDQLIESRGYHVPPPYVVKVLLFAAAVGRY